MTLYNPNVDSVTDNVHTKFGLILSIHSQDIEQKSNYDRMTKRKNDGQGKSSIAPLFRSGAIKISNIVKSNLFRIAFDGRRIGSQTPKLQHSNLLLSHH